VNISTIGGGSGSSEAVTSPQLATYARRHCADLRATLLTGSTAPIAAGTVGQFGEYELACLTAVPTLER
jgi:hypothetical protein